MLSSKSKFIASESLTNFFRTHRSVWFVTFSEPGRHGADPLWTKDEAEVRFKPFRDYCNRNHIDLLVVWQQQKRGSWHPHCLIDRFVDVNWCRPWMVGRGWGPQMYFVLLKRSGVVDGGTVRRTVRYLTRYLTQWSRVAVPALKKKLFCGQTRNKVGTTAFKWMPQEKAGAFLYEMGRGLFIEIYGRSPRWRDMSAVIRLGVENSGWADVDFLWMFSVPSG